MDRLYRILGKAAHSAHPVLILGDSGNVGEWTFPDYPLRGVFANNCVYESVRGWDAFEPALTRAEEMDSDAIWRCAADIPEEWYEGDRRAASLGGRTLPSPTPHSEAHQRIS